MSLLSLVAQSGEGQPLVIIGEENADGTIIPELCRGLSLEMRVVYLTCAPVTDENWSMITQSLIETLDSLGVRQASFLSVSDAGAVVQHLALLALKRVRRLVLINARTRPHPSRFSRLIDWIESKLPLGLPLRAAGRAFDSKPFLHRIRCPVLVVVTADGGETALKQAHFLSAHLPTSWFVQIQEVGALLKVISEFQGVAAKRPRKNVGEGRAAS